MDSNSFEKLRHPTENTRFWLALVATTPLTILGLVLVVASDGLALLAIATAVPAIWFSIKLTEASFKANLVRVSELNFPEIKAIIDDARERLDYRPQVDAYVREGNANAFLVKFLGTKFLVINADFVDASSRDELVWLVGRFIGSLRAKHDRLTLLSVLISSSEKLLLLNLFLYPYERAVVHSADQMGLHLSGNLGAALTALNRTVVGKDVHRYVNTEGMLEQYGEVEGSFLAWLVCLLSRHPHTVERHANLVRFARERMPEVFAAYEREPDPLPKRLFDDSRPTVPSLARVA